MAKEKIPTKDDSSLFDIESLIKRVKEDYSKLKEKLDGLKKKMRVLSPWISLIRPNIGLLSAFGVLVGAAVSEGLILPALMFAMLASFLISSAGIVINDYFDLESDLINQPLRPLPSGDISERAAISSWAILTLSGLILAFYTSQPFFMIATVNVIVSILYSWHLQDRAVIGNLADSFLAAITFIAGGLIASNLASLEPALTILAAIAFLGNLSREIFKDVEDVKGDRRKKAETLPLIVGRKKSSYLAKVILIVALLIAPTPFLLGFFGLFYLLLIVPVQLISIYPLFISYKQPEKSQKILKMSMFGFMIAFLLSALVSIL